jgi:hypothetical protein
VVFTSPALFLDSRHDCARTFAKISCKLLLWGVQFQASRLRGQRRSSVHRFIPQDRPHVFRSEDPVIQIREQSRPESNPRRASGSKLNMSPQQDQHSSWATEGVEIMPSQHQPPQLERALSALETSEALVLRLRTGLVDGHRHSLLEVGEFLGATRTEARSLEWSGWQKLEARARGDRESLVALRYLLGRTKSSFRTSTVLN